MMTEKPWDQPENPAARIYLFHSNNTTTMEYETV